MVLSDGGDMGMSYRSFGLTLIGGMTSASLFTLLVVPVFYTIFDDAHEIISAAFAGVFSKNTKSSVAK